MKGEKFHYGQTAGRPELPKCNGGNGIYGVDCSSALGYPRKLDEELV